MKVQKLLTKLSLSLLTTPLLIISAVSSVKAESSIDPVSQAYFVSESDAIAGTTFERIYSSRSIHRGYLGAGWCSELDARILIFDGGESRYRGCDLRNAAMVDERVRDSRRVQLSLGGYQRTREDGAIQRFDREGWLIGLDRKKTKIEIRRDALGVPFELIAQKKTGAKIARLKIESGLLSEVTSGGRTLRFQYQDALLMKSPESRFAYDHMLNMITWVHIGLGVNELVVYDDQEDRAVQIARSDASGDTRRLLTLGRKGTSVEMKIEEERGAETHPVFVSYNKTTGRLSMQGNRELAMILLSWIRV